MFWNSALAQIPRKKGSSRNLGGANKGLGEAPKAARGRSMKARPTQSRGGVKGQLPLAGSRDSVPCGVWGNAPTVPRATSMPNALNKGAGSEASLPVTLRVLRRAPKLLFPPLAHCRASWARPNSMTADHSWSFPQAGVSPLRRRPKGSENRRSLRSPFGNLRVATTVVDFDCGLGEREHPQNAQHLLSS